MTTLTFTVKKQIITVEVPDGFEVAVAGDKISVRQQAIAINQVPYTWTLPLFTSPYAQPYTPPYGTTICSGVISQ